MARYIVLESNGSWRGSEEKKSHLSMLVMTILPPLLLWNDYYPEGASRLATTTMMHNKSQCRAQRFHESGKVSLIHWFWCAYRRTIGKRLLAGQPPSSLGWFLSLPRIHARCRRRYCRAAPSKMYSWLFSDERSEKNIIFDTYRITHHPR